jgi:hypothetical protein
MSGVRLDVVPDDVRASMEYDVPQPLGRPGRCTPCSMRGDRSIKDDLTVTKQHWSIHPEGHLVIRCRWHQQWWEDTH